MGVLDGLFGFNGLQNTTTENESIARQSAIMGIRDYYGTYNSFSGADIVAYIHIPPQRLPGTEELTAPTVGVLGNIQTISYSSFREVNPVRALGKIYPSSYTRGPRTIAGTLVWTVFDQYVLAEALKNTMPTLQPFDVTTVLVDQLPPFNVIITFNNEYGDVSTMGIYGIRIVNEGATFSIDDMITEQTNSYVAAGIDLMHKGPPFKNQNTQLALTTGTDLLMREAQRRMSNQSNAFQ